MNCPNCGEDYWINGRHYGEPGWVFCYACEFKRKETHADRIRSLNDDDLADELYDNSNIDCCRRETILEWLKKEV